MQKGRRYDFEERKLKVTEVGRPSTMKLPPLHQVRNLGRITRNRLTLKSSSS